MVHFGCSDSFTLKTPEFAELARDLAMQIAASSPAAVDSSSLDPAIRNRELSYYREKFEALSEPEKLDRMEEKNRSINEQFCLLEQPFIRNPSQTVQERVDEVETRLKDKIEILKFIRWEADET